MPSILKHYHPLSFCKTFPGYTKKIEDQKSNIFHIIHPLYKSIISTIYLHQQSNHLSIANILKSSSKLDQEFPFSHKIMRMILFLTLVLFLQGALGDLVCEDLPVGMCSFSISSSGNRCSLETFESADGTVELQCKTSQVMSINMHEYIENDECVLACGVDRNSVGISSDALLETQFTTQLCSPPCLQKCPNIVDLYYNLALAEGVLLDELCKFQQTSSRRSVIQLQSSSAAAAGPISAAAIAPTPFSSGSSSVNCAPAPLSVYRQEVEGLLISTAGNDLFHPENK